MSLLLFSAIALFLSKFTAQNPYSNYTVEVLIPFTANDNNTAVPFTDNIKVKMSVRRGSLKKSHHPIIDTGTCGYVMSTDGFPGWSQSLADANEVGWEWLSSSKKLYSGHWIPADIYFTDLAPVEVKAQIKILVVEDVTICPHWVATDLNICPTPVGGTAPVVTHLPVGENAINLFGVGFGRQSDGQPQGTPDKNAFLNVISIDGVLTASNPLFHNGYIISASGITIGLTGANTENMVFQDLRPGPNPDPRDKLPTQACIGVDSMPCVDADVLFDTGIGHSYLTLPYGSPVTIVSGTSPSTHQPVSVLANDQTMKMCIDGESSQMVFSEFIVGNASGISSGVAPDMVITQLRNPAEKAPFFNTGRHFFRRWKFAYDPLARIGLKKYT
jgi:hypothetical protein